MYGIERVLLNLLPALRGLGQPAGLLCLASKDSEGAQVGKLVEDLGLPVWYAGFRGRVSVPGTMNIRRIIGQCSPRLVHLHGYKATIVGGALALLSRRPAVATYHGEAGKALDLPRLSTYARIETHFLRRLRGVAAVSRPVRDELLRRGLRAGCIEVIPNGIEPLARRPGSLEGAVPSEFSPVLMVVGRLIREKNIQLAIEILSTVRDLHPTAGLVVAGEGPLRSELEDAVRRTGLIEWVRFLGFVGDVAGLLTRCDCFLLPSLTEGMPIALLEAMAVGVPIVASAVGGIPEVVRDGVDGILVPPDDSRRACEAVLRVLSDSGLAARLRDHSQDRFAREFTALRMAERYVRFYDCALQQGAK